MSRIRGVTKTTVPPILVEPQVNEPTEKRRTGRPRKVQAPIDVLAIPVLDAAEKPPLKKRAHKKVDNTVGNDDGSEPLKKVQKKNDAAKPTPKATPLKRARKPTVKQIEVATIVASKPPKQHVAPKRKASAAESALRLEEEIRKGDEAKRILAQMHLDEEKADLRLKTQNTLRLSAVTVARKRGRNEVTTSGDDGEGFDLDVSGSDSEMESTPVKAKSVGI